MESRLFRIFAPMDQPKLERLLRLMKLLTANTTYNVDQLAERLSMSRRTVYRYIDTFREAGFVIKKTGDCIRLDKESPPFPRHIATGSLHGRRSRDTEKRHRKHR